jgi:hypothetical protein
VVAVASVTGVARVLIVAAAGPWRLVGLVLLIMLGDVAELSVPVRGFFAVRSVIHRLS